jgi:hypothetical protein
MTPAQASIKLCCRMLQILPAERERALDGMGDLLDIGFSELPPAMRKPAAFATVMIAIAAFNYLACADVNRDR